jgi:flagellar biosynthesis protein FlhF
MSSKESDRMKVRRFVGRDSRSTMAQVRAELGPDAVILSNKKIDGQVELMVALNLDDAMPNSGASIYRDAVASTLVENTANSPTLIDLQNELGNLRSLLEGQLSQLAWREMVGQPSAKATVYSRLVNLGLSRTLCRKIVDKLPATGELAEHWQAAQGLLAQGIRTMPEGELVDNGGIIALVGSTGVGKTTTVAKLAANAIIRYGNDQVALLTTDCHRIGAQEQLATFADYLDIPTLVATNGKQLAAGLDKLSGRKMILVDTAGMSQRDSRLHEQLSMLNSVAHNIDTYVVLPATAQQRALHEVVKALDPQLLSGAIITKVDESASLGGVLDVVIRRRLKLAYVSAGQNVPEDISPARADELVRSAISQMSRTAFKDSDFKLATDSTPSKKFSSHIQTARAI